MKTIVSAVVVALLAAGPVAGPPPVSLDKPVVVVIGDGEMAHPDNFFRHVMCLVRKIHC